MRSVSSSPIGGLCNRKEDTLNVFTYLIMLLRQSIKDHFGVVNIPRPAYSANYMTKIDKTNSPRTGAEGGGLGGRLRSAVTTIRSFLKSMTNDLIDGAKTFYTPVGATPILRRVRATSFRDQFAAA